MLPTDSDPLTRLLEALDERHLANLTHAEVARALRALSSCYVERRGRLASGAALETAGKRAAFALFYAPLHFLTIRNIVGALPASLSGVREIIDVGCGTGVAGAAWALTADAASVTGFDRNPWAVDEANWTYRQLGLTGRAVRSDASRLRLEGAEGAGIIAAYTVNELAPEVRDRLLQRLLRCRAGGARILIVEPIARRDAAWWDGWSRAFGEAGGRADEWRFEADLPPRQRLLARAAGLDPRELTAKSLFVASS
jgi:SAM-dependent methyltransferase